MPTYVVQVEVNVFDDDDTMSVREIAERGWQAVLDLEAPVVRVINAEQQLDTEVDLEESVSDLPSGYRWADAEETERIDTIPGALLVTLTTDSNGTPYTEGEADWAVPE